MSCDIKSSCSFYRIYPEDERIERYERAVSMAINGLGYTLRQLGEEYLYEEEVTDIWQGVLKESRLWKLSRHKNPLVDNRNTSKPIITNVNSDQYSD